MDYKIFLDTNIYDASNYSFRNAMFSVLKEMAKNNELQLRINSVVEREVKKHIKCNVKKAAKGLLEAVKNMSLAGFQKLPVYMDKLQIPAPNDWVKMALNEFEQLLSDCNAVRISSNGIDVEMILEDYFQQNKPFEEAKPEEFKDAIIVAAIINDLQTITEDELYCVVSNDNGFRDALLEKAEKLIPKQKDCLKVFSRLAELTEYLCYLNDHVAYVKEYLQSGAADFVFEDSAQEIVNDAMLEIEAASYGTDEYEVLDIVQYKFVPYIIGIYEEKIAKVAVNVSCQVKIWYSYIDLDESYYDKEEHRYLWRKEIEKEEKYNLSFDMILVLDVEKCKPGINPEDAEIAFEEYLDMPSNLNLYENCRISSKTIVDNSKDLSDESEWNMKDVYDTCPDCGHPINYQNDGGNGFCVDCASNH